MRQSKRKRMRLDILWTNTSRKTTSASESQMGGNRHVSPLSFGMFTIARSMASFFATFHFVLPYWHRHTKSYLSNYKNLKFVKFAFELFRFATYEQRCWRLEQRIFVYDWGKTTDHLSLRWQSEERRDDRTRKNNYVPGGRKARR